MSEPYLAEVRIFGFNFAPRGWAFCDGQILPIQQNQALYSLLGTTYGGDGRTTFALPDLRGRTPIHVGDGFNLGNRGGEESPALTVNEIPSHTHQAKATSDIGTNPNPGGRVLASSAPAEVYGPPNNQVDLRAGTVANTGAGQGHENMQPYLALTFAIALQGTFPPRN